MKHNERYTIKTNKGKVLGYTDDIEEALEIREKHKQEGAFIEDRKNPNKHRERFFH